MADDTDPMFEFFDAPKYVDFTDMDNLMEDDGADQWFDYHNEEDGEFEDNFVPSEDNPLQSLATPAHLIEDKQQPVNVASAVKKEPSVPTTSDEPTSNSEKKVPNLKKFFPKKDHLHKEKRSPRLAANKAKMNIKCILSKRQSPGKTRVRKPSGDSQHSGSKTTEDLQMEEIKRLQMETRKKLRQNRRSFQKLASTSGPIAVKGTKPPTEAKEFNFHTKKKDTPVSAKSKAMNVANFPSTLRSSSSTETFNPNFPTKPATPDGVTKVKPFHFHLDERMNQKSVYQTQGDVPMAEAILKFEKSTPPRFRRNPTPSKKNAMNASTGSCGKPSKTVKLTLPKTPKLTTKERSRPVCAVSAAEEEDKEVTKMKEYRFKANPLNPDIFNKGGLLGVPRKRKDFHVTEPHTPELATKKRCLSHRTEEQQEEAQADGSFRANPMPNFDKIKGVPEKKMLPVTEPETPVITAKRRCLSDEDDSREEEMDHVIKANPLPDLSKAFKVDLPHRILQIKPFSFEGRDKEKPTRETFVQRILRNEKKPEFRAQPLPDFGEVPSLPPKTHILPTKVEPFSLKTELRGQQHFMKFQEQVEEEIRGARKDAEFKAHETTVLYSKPFVPKKSNKPLATIDNFQLHTEMRHEKRLKFDAERFRKEREIETENLKRKTIREAEEAKDIVDYRKTLVHKAQPIHQYQPIVIHSSDKQVTEPISPHFLTDERLGK